MPRTPARPQPLVVERTDRIQEAIPDEPLYQVAERRGRPGVWLGWLASAVIWGLVIWAGYAYRADIMAAWPPSQRLYVALGLGPGS